MKSIESAEPKAWYKSEYTSKSRAEEFANEILTNNGTDKLNAIEKITRTASYNPNHTGVTKNEASNRTEERIALDMFNKNYAVGHIRDYQIPLKNSNEDTGVGDIDLMAYNKDNQTLTLLELKQRQSDETLLRAVLEIFTYWKILDHQKLLVDYGMPQTTIVKKAVLLFEHSYAYNEYMQKLSPKTIELMGKLDVEFYGIRKEADEYEVFMIC